MCEPPLFPDRCRRRRRCRRPSFSEIAFPPLSLSFPEESIWPHTEALDCQHQTLPTRGGTHTVM